MVDENYLRKLLQSGQITQAQLSQMNISGGSLNMLAQAMQMQAGDQMGGRDSDLMNAVAGQGFQGLQSGQGVIQQTNEDGSQNAPIRINSMQSQRPQMPERDMTRNPVDLPTGRGYYGKDGQVYNANGTRYLTPETQAQNAAMSMAAQDRQMKMEQMRGQMAKTTAETNVLNARPSTPVDKPPPGYAWAAGGKLQAIPGGPADMKIGEAAMARNDAAKGVLDSGAMALSQIDQLIGKRDASGAMVTGQKAHPGFETAVGISGWDGGFGAAGFIPGTDTTNFKTRLDQLKGGAFLQAFNSLKGGGAITELEGKKATDAITRMSTSQSEKEFVQAAQEYRQVIEQGMARAQMKAQGVQPATQSASGQHPSDIQSLLSKYGK